ncbi:tyrosine-protein kinase receptor TYRO3-like [Ptychodera flava]|uniref:tyrosine-protein kinase receptor TYRO3-like n=1 Tax=Ptychodera flava TaxID=63121 RepID=UPI00396A26D1
MAPECFKKQHYDTKTDVWAYGVLLWEIMTKGETPYPAIDNSELVDYLDKGKRLKKPPNTPDEVYHIMHACWQLDPDLRPDFKDIVHTMDKMLKSTDEESESNYYLTPVSSEYIDVY